MQTLEYDRKSRASLRQLILLRILPGICIVAVLYMMCVVGYIEVLNSKVGGILPRRDDGRWCHSLVTRPEVWRNIRALQTEDDTWRTRHLSAAAQSEMDREIHRNALNNDLLDGVQNFGITLYIIAPVTLIVAGAVAMSHRKFDQHKVVALLAVVCSACTLIVCVWHGYFSSLGM